MTIKNAVTVLEQGLAVCLATTAHDANMRARMAEDSIRGALGFLAEVPVATGPAGSLSLLLVDGSTIDATELAQEGVVVGVLGVDFHLPSEADGANAVADDEIDEDPEQSEDAIVHITDAGITTSGPVVVLDERTEPGAPDSAPVDGLQGSAKA